MLQLLSKSLRQKVATITHFYSMLGLVAGKSCNLWVSCNFRVLQLVGYRLYIVCTTDDHEKICTGVLIDYGSLI